jgi:cephalosporin-C deacetylase-like acetyl esterase
MSNKFYLIIIDSLIILVCLFVLSSFYLKGEFSSSHINIVPFADTVKQKANLDKLLGLLPPDRIANGRVSFLDETFQDWLKRTGELPPDFDRMPSIPFLPDPLIIDEGGKNIPIKTMAQWKEKRVWMKKQLEYYITGTYPPKPENLKSKVISEIKNGETIVRMVELTFGPENKATLTVELMIPPGKGPFPVFLSQWNHREWAMVAVRRGYIGCIYAGADSKDDTEKYSEIWSGQYDFTRLMRRSFASWRAIDYLYTLPYVDKEKIGITGHSRNGKLSLMAAAFDERITACIPSSGGTGAEVPWRYCSPDYDNEDMASIVSSFPSWFHPRLRFFVGRENKLPVDQNFFMALIAPRGLLLSAALTEEETNPWGIEQVYLASQKVYKFLGAENNLAIRSRYGLHSVCARDIEDYIDFFDYIFKPGKQKPENKLFYNYSFENWCALSGEKIDPLSFKVKSPELTKDEKNNNIISITGWESKKTAIRKQLQWVLGDEPSGVINPGPGRFRKSATDESSFGSFLVRPGATRTMGRMPISPYNGFGDQLFGYLYYPCNEKGELKNKNLPVVIYLHEYDYSRGYSSNHQVESLFQSIVDKGYAVFSYDMLGFGNRIEEGTRFYNRYPHWSKMGKMVVDVKGAVEALRNLDFVDSTKIFVAGYSLGATVGLYAAAMDERIAGVISVAGFTPMRLNTFEKGTEGIKAYSHLHGLLPRLGFFVGNETRIPCDFHEILACIAPRPILVIAPVMDKDAIIQDVTNCVEQVRKVYILFGVPGNIQLFSPDDYNRFSPEMRGKTCEWLQEKKMDSRSGPGK